MVGESVAANPDEQLEKGIHILCGPCFLKPHFISLRLMSGYTGGIYVPGIYVPLGRRKGAKL